MAQRQIAARPSSGKGTSITNPSGVQTRSQASKKPQPAARREAAAPETKSQTSRAERAQRREERGGSRVPEATRRPSRKPTQQATAEEPARGRTSSPIARLGNIVDDVNEIHQEALAKIDDAGTQLDKAETDRQLDRVDKELARVEKDLEEVSEKTAQFDKIAQALPPGEVSGKEVQRLRDELERDARELEEAAALMQKQFEETEERLREERQRVYEEEGGEDEKHVDDSDDEEEESKKAKKAKAKKKKPAKPTKSELRRKGQPIYVAGPRIHRLAHKAGIRRVSADIKVYSRELMTFWLRAVIRKALNYMAYARRSTLTAEDVVRVLWSPPFKPLYGYGSPEPTRG